MWQRTYTYSSRFLISQNKWKWVFLIIALAITAQALEGMSGQVLSVILTEISTLLDQLKFFANFPQMFSWRQFRSRCRPVQDRSCFFFSAVLGWEVCFESLSCWRSHGLGLGHRAVCFTPKHEVKTPNAWGSKTIPRNQSASSMFDAIIGSFFLEQLGVFFSFLFWQEWMELLNMTFFKF